MLAASPYADPGKMPLLALFFQLTSGNKSRALLEKAPGSAEKVAMGQQKKRRERTRVDWWKDGGAVRLFFSTLRGEKGKFKRKRCEGGLQGGRDDGWSMNSSREGGDGWSV